VDVKQAAEALGISSEGVRQRIRRGSLKSEKDSDGRVYVWLDDTARVDGSRTDGSTDAVLTRLEAENAFLRQELATRDEEIRRRDAILLNMTEGLKALGPPEPREAFVTVSEDSGRGKGDHDQTEPQGGSERRSWLHRFFLGE
jgi:hypothetical protein